MTAFIASTVVLNSFRRLAYVPSSDNATKTSLERTSSLMYFFAFDIVAKRNHVHILDINLDSFDGKNMRSDFILEYARLVQLKKTPTGELQHVAALGNVQIGGKPPEGKIRSNFLSVPVDKASIAQDTYAYPRRPAPLLLLGTVATEKKFGITYHPNCEQNLSLFLTGLKSRIPYTDLAIFLCRNEQVTADIHSDGKEVLLSIVRSKFSERIANYFVDKIESEKIFSNKYIAWNKFLSDTFLDEISLNETHSRKDELQNMKKSELIELILNLEGEQ